VDSLARYLLGRHNFLAWKFDSLAHVIRHFNHVFPDYERRKYHVLANYLRRQFYSLAHIFRHFNYLFPDYERGEFHYLLANHVGRRYNHSKSHHYDQNQHYKREHNLPDPNVCSEHDHAGNNDQRLADDPLPCDDLLCCNYHLPGIYDELSYDHQH
jgi:hypothetical protein